MAAVTSRGEVFTWGSDSHGQLGRSVRSVTLRARGQGRSGSSASLAPRDKGGDKGGPHASATFAPMEVDIGSLLNSRGRAPPGGGGGGQWGTWDDKSGGPGGGLWAGAHCSARRTPTHWQGCSCDGSGS